LQRAAREFSYAFGDDDNSTDLQKLRENIAGLTFYFDDLTVTTKVESKAVSESALLSRLCSIAAVQ